MCGIAGVITSRLDNRIIGEATARMTHTLAHRGPDGEAFWHGDGVCFGHRRLSIIDLSPSGSQPMTNENGQLVLVCNGEIYNAPSLRTKLLARGHDFRGSSDSEVILHLYEEYGVDCVKHLIGMFAFALWDATARTLMIARDRIGEKPLHYAKTDGSFWFASEPKALLCAPGVNGDLEPEAISSLMMFPSAPAPLTFFKGIRALPPASFAILKNGVFSQHRYWSMNYADSARKRTLNEEREAFDSLWTDVIRDNCHSDVPLGVTLSGGVDSSSVAAEIASQPELLSFCLNYSPDGQPDPELILSQKVADVLGLEHRSVPFNPNDISLLPSIIAAHDQPFPTFPIIQAEQLAQGISKERKVALTGSGADEIFGGYKSYRRTRLLGIGLSIANTLPKIPFLNSQDSLSGRMLSAARLPIGLRRGFLMQKSVEAMAKNILSDHALNRLKDDRPAKYIDQYAEECAPRDYLDTVTYSDLMVAHQHSTNVMTEIAGMTHGLEYRAPFLDVRILEYSAGLDRAHTIPLLKRKVTKRILREALVRRLPSDIVYAPKMGFGWNVSYANLLKGLWRPVVDAFVRKGRYLQLGYITPQGADWAAENSPSVCWTLLCLSIWGELFLEKRTVAELSNQIVELVGSAPR